MKNLNRQEGFSLIELLIVVAIIGIIAAIAIPNFLASRRAANEGAAASAIRSVHSAQGTFQATNGAGSFATDLTILQGERLIDSVLGGAAQSVKAGYQFEIVDAAGNGSTAVYGVYAFPAQDTGVAQTGTRKFGTTESGVLRGNSDLASIPNTRALIGGLPPMGN